ncbi:MAG: TlpA disulfide reductase family protein [Dehalococcoidales bacterium]|jgi:peroxiredoxin
MKIKIVFAFICLLIMVLPATSCQKNSISAGNPAPDFELPLLDGESIALSSLQGRPVLLNFWALSCPYCLAEMPYIQQAHNTYSNEEQGLAVVTINIRDSSSAITSYLEYGNYNLKVLRDNGAHVATEYGVDGIPVTVLIDKNGIIRDVVIGAFPNWPTLENRLAAIIE